MGTDRVRDHTMIFENSITCVDLDKSAGPLRRSESSEMSEQLRLTQKVRFSYENYKNHMESLILAQNERWRRGLGMQVERERIFRDSVKWQTGE